MTKTLSTFLGIVLLLVSVFALDAQAQVRLQLGFLVDGSGSISSGDFQTVIDSLAASLEDTNLVPQDGSIEVTVVQFSNEAASAQVTPIIVTSATISDIVQRVRGISQGGGGTPLWSGIDVIADLMRGSPNYDGADRRTINVATDGQPQVPVQSIPASVGIQLSLASRDRAIGLGIDEIDAEGVGAATTDTGFQNFLLSLVWPQPGVLINDGDSNSFSPGFVTLVREFADFEAAIRNKIEAILGSVGLNGNGGAPGPGTPGTPRGPGGTAPGPGGRPIPLDTPFGSVLLSGLFVVMLVIVRFRGTLGHSR